MKTRTKSEGFALIEVLLAIVILAIGLLAGSRMQILGLGFTQGATTRSYATMAANDILDRMRLNPEGLASYHGFSTAGNIPADQGCNFTTPCDATQRANQDLRDWASYFRKANGQGTHTQLPPGATGAIALDSGGAMTIVTVTWKDLINGSESDTQQVSVGIVL